MAVATHDVISLPGSGASDHRIVIRIACDNTKNLRRLYHLSQ